MIKAILTDLRVSKAPEIKTSANGKVYTSVFCSSYVGKDKDGNSKYLNIRVSMFGKTAERSAELQKGSLINVCVNITDLTHYMRNDGGVSCTLECTADTYEKPLGSRSADNAQQNNASPAQRQAPAAPAEDDEDGLPF